MKTVDELFMRAPTGVCFEVAADVERWPDVLSHYRWVRFLEKRGFGHGCVEMAAWRGFIGPVRYPTWWVSEMRCDADEPAVYYRHVRGITEGMDVKWSFRPAAGHDDAERDDVAHAQATAGTHVRITHDWQGPDWPLIGRFAWSHVIAPHFVHVIASRTLRGVAAEAERRWSGRVHRDVVAPPKGSLEATSR